MLDKVLSPSSLLSTRSLFSQILIISLTSFLVLDDGLETRDQAPPRPARHLQQDGRRRALECPRLSLPRALIQHVFL